jgi:thymidylate synthase (FAD)
MHWVTSSIQPYERIVADDILRKIEYAGRTCYRSFDKCTGNIEDTKKFIANAIKRGHESILEHVNITFEVVCSRDVLAQWTRHRIAAYSVESQRYCNYTKDKFNGFTFIMPYGVNEDMAAEIRQAVEEDVEHYNSLIAMGAKPEQARAVLGNCTKTQFIWTANLREIRHFIKLRTAAGAQPDIAVLAEQVYNILYNSGLQCIVEDINAT